MKNRADIEVLFEFIGFRKGRVFEGYIPSHLVKEGYLTTGIHSYYNLNQEPCDNLRGTITFITPEAYPHTMWVGKRITMYEGGRIVGYAVVTKIFNSILLCNKYET